MIQHDLLEQMQSAYKPCHSTETALLKVHNDILCQLDKGQGVYLALLDLSAAFDTVDHEVLLELLESYVGIEGTALSLFRSYLTQRSQCVVVENVMSELVTLLYGVPQGSVLGPLKFCLYTLPLGAIVRHHGLQFHIYADDTQLYIAFDHKNPELAIDKLNACIADIRSWMIRNKLKINDGKTEFLVISSPYLRTELPQCKLKVGKSVIAKSCKAKNLGVMFDCNINMENHVSEVCKSLYCHLKNIGCIRKMLTDEAAVQLVHSLISSRLDYCNSLMYGLPNSSIQRLQRMQNIAARIVSRCPKYCHITPVLKSLHWLPVKARIHFKILLLMFKAVNGLAPHYLCEMIVGYVPVHALRSADKDLLVVPKARCKTLGDRAFSVAGPREWNRLPSFIKQIKSVQLFKKSLKTYLFSMYFD